MASHAYHGASDETFHARHAHVNASSIHHIQSIEAKEDIAKQILPLCQKIDSMASLTGPPEHVKATKWKEPCHVADGLIGAIRVAKTATIRSATFYLCPAVINIGYLRKKHLHMQRPAL